MDIACDSDVDVAEEVRIVLSNSEVFTNADFVQGGCRIVGGPLCEDGWSIEEYESITGIDATELE